MNLALKSDKFEVKRLLGLLLGLTGVAIIAAPGATLAPGLVAFLPVALIGPLFYALEGTFVARYGMAGMDPIQAMFGASLMALAICLPLVIVSGSWVSPMPPWGKAEGALLISSGLHALLYAGYVGLAAKAGATYVSPFIGRLDDVSYDGVLLIEQIVHIYDNYGYKTEVLAASIRHAMHIIRCAEAGADVATCPLSAITDLLKHPLTDIGLAKFLADAKGQ
jgi:uncharacterized membrane protein